jgi:hypothetical protein
MQEEFVKNISYFGAYQLLCAVVFILFSSIGAFFHFLLNHEISIVESWLHNNHWEILILAKFISLFLLNRWFHIRLYHLKPIRTLFMELVRWPDHRAIVVSVFMIVSYLSLSGTNFVGQNLGYWYFHLIAFFGLLLYFGVDFVVIAYLQDVLQKQEGTTNWKLSLVYTAFFTLSFRLCVPDYYNLMPFVIFSFSALLFLSGRSFKSWSNVVCFLIVFIAPMGAFFGMDPVWGDDFSPFPVKTKLTLPFLGAIWMVSFSYYKYRDHFISGARKLIR